MTRDEFGRMALGAPALQSIVMVTLPDCLLLKQWARQDGGDGDSAAAHIGGAFRRAQDALRAMLATSAEGSVSIETDDALLVIAPLGSDAAAGYLFDRSAPLGLVRLQVAQLNQHLSALVASIRGSRDLSGDLGVSAPPTVLPRPTAVPTPAPAPAAKLPQPSPLSVPPIAPPAASPPPAAPTRAPVPPVASAPPAASTRASAPSSYAQLAAAQRFQASPSAQAGGPAMTTDASARPRAVRLLEFFRRYAPDPHASMLRLSLRTGISLERLESPEAFDDTQVEVLAASVRDILGQDNVGV